MGTDSDMLTENELSENNGSLSFSSNTLITISAYAIIGLITSLSVTDTSKVYESTISASKVVMVNTSPVMLLIRKGELILNENISCVEV